MPFLPYEQHQMTFLPPSLDELIPADDLVRVVDAFVESLPTSGVEALFVADLGRPLYHPRMMLKVILYAYSQKVYSCRRIAKALRQNVCFMWLAARQTPEFNTINRFRSVYLAPCLDEVFPHLARFLLDKKYIKGEDYFVDGTKVEADANRHSFVWRKNTERYSEAVRERARQIMAEARAIDEAEDRELGADRDLLERGDPAAKLTAEEIARAARGCSKAAEEVGEKQAQKSLKRAAKSLEEEAEKLGRYEEQAKTLGGRNSYSKTDTDATFMRMKNTKDILPAYNLQIGGEGGFVLCFSLSQNSSDARSFVDHMAELARLVGGVFKPRRVMADAGYGHEENYECLKKNKIGNFLKDPRWWRARKGKLRPFEKESFGYDKENDRYVCPMGESLRPRAGDIKTTTYHSGYISQSQIYACGACASCPKQSECVYEEGKNRTIQRSAKLEEGRQEARANLDSEIGEELRKRRGVEIEAPFGDLKHNQGVRRTRLRGKIKARIDLGWAIMAGNLRKIWKLESKPG